MGKYDAIKGQGGNTFRAIVVTFLSCGQQGVQHLNRRFKHLDELHDPLVSAAQRARVTIRIRIVLGVMFEFTNIHLADQRRNILVVFIAGFRFGDGNLLQNGGPDFHHAEFSNIAAKLMQAFGRPRGHNRTEIAARNTVLFFQNLRVFLRIKQA